MSTRIVTTRRLRSAAAGVVVAAVAGGVLMPLSAQAAPVAADGKPLTIELGAPAPAGPLTRGGETESFSFTVKNSSDQPVDFQPWMVAQSDGPSPIAASQIVFDVEPVNAPATDEVVGQQDTSAQGIFYPAEKGEGSTFAVPAKGELSWKVTVGLGKNYPTNNGNLKLTAADLGGRAAQQESVVFDIEPKIKSGELSTWFGNGPEGVIRPGTPQNLNFYLKAEGEGGFDSALVTRLQVETTADGSPSPELGIEVYDEAGRTWKKLKPLAGYVHMWQLPDVPKGFGADGQVKSFPLRVSVLGLNGIKKDTAVTLQAGVALAEGNTFPFAGARGKITVGPKTGADNPGGKPSASPSPSPSATTSASPSPSATPSATETTSAPAATGGSNLTTTGELASTGSDNTSVYGAAAAALVAVGAVVAWFGVRRRRAQG
ncbi:hypothetical protein GCM10020367_30570 [Streptomyces sannanensis]|uniref:Gram-positive cocci surface proteins LPxTG domain-containing protein n=1 Tax=Streptomyces sannanensis TaxID=285536 RepID=A0ABP6SBR7_9ACTN